MRMGTLLRTLYRNSAALEAHRQAYALNPNDAEIALVRGFSEHDFGDQSEAKKMYEQVVNLEIKGKGMWNLMRSDTYTGAAVEGLDLLNRRQPSPWSVSSDDPISGREKTVARSSPTQPSPSRKRHLRKNR